MGRVQIGGQQGTTHNLRNVRVKTRYSCLEERITFKGALEKRPGRERQQEKWVKDAPILELLFDEYWARVEDMTKVLLRGWELITAEPCEAWMGDLILNRTTRAVEMSAKVETNNVLSTCGFIIDITPAFVTAVTLVADRRWKRLPTHSP
jgi:hypothetical protein